MLGTVDRHGNLLGVDSLLARLFDGDDDSFYARMAAHGHELIADGDFAECYAARRGRPSIPPSLLMRAVLCQIRDDVSDREAARRCEGSRLETGVGCRGRRDPVPSHDVVGVPVPVVGQRC
jgi:hypothetical protein